MARMSTDVLLVVLCAALLNAGWNSAIKIGTDRTAAMALTTLLGSAISLLALPFVEWPQPAGWALLAWSIVIHTAYHLALPLAYDHGDMGQVYPLARGTAPLWVLVAAGLLAGEWPGSGAIAGVACLCTGVLLLALQRAAHRNRTKAVGFALLTGVLIAAYTVVDALGARNAGSALGFAVCVTLGDGVATALAVLVWKGRTALQADGRTLALCAAAAAMQMGSYWLVVWALARAPMAAVSALRESSVLFVALISALLIKEGMGTRRIGAAVLVFIGIGLMRLGS
jgi:drug/metabolite transporter (DMT)-like permease